jgi:hypothetical protein
VAPSSILPGHCGKQDLGHRVATKRLSQSDGFRGNDKQSGESIQMIDVDVVAISVAVAADGDSIVVVWLVFSDANALVVEKAVVIERVVFVRLAVVVDAM